MTDDELKAINGRDAASREALRPLAGVTIDPVVAAVLVSQNDVPALVAEVKRLNDLLVIALRPEKCLCGRDMDVSVTCSICDNDD